MRKILYILIFLLTLSFMMGCSRSVDKRLVLADTLMWTAPDSSLKILTAINRDSLQDKENLAYHALLLTQAQFRCYIPLTSDTLISKAVDYYSGNHNREHYTRALLFKGAAYEDMSQPVEAIKWYKRAENNADSTDYRNLAQINFRMGKLYYDIFISTGEDIEKFKRALYYYRVLGEKDSELLCLLYIGSKHRVSNDPNTVLFLQEAKKTAIELKDTASIVNAMQFLSRYYFYDSCYEEAHKIAQSCITSYPRHITEDIILDEARTFAKMGKIDSAQMYMNLVQPINEYDISQVYRLYTLADIAMAKGDIAQYAKNKQLADSFCDMAQIKRDKLKLPQIEDNLNELRIQHSNSKKELFGHVILLLIALIILSAIVFCTFHYRKKKEWESLLEEHKNANTELINKNIEVSNVNKECKLAIYDLLKKIDSWVKMKQSMPENLFASRFENSFILGKKKKDIRIEDGDFWLNMQNLADATFGKDLKNLEEKFPRLSKDDLYIIALKYLGFSYITIAVCMGYKDKSYVNKKKDRIPKKIGLDMTFDEFLNSLKNKS